MIVYGHRGARGEAPENTITGCQHAAGRGVRHFEIDLRLSADGELVVIHDESLQRTTGVRGKVGSRSADELWRLHANHDGTPWPGKRDTGIPRWNTLYRRLPQVKHWQLELKAGSKGYNRDLAGAVIQWLGKPRRDCTVTSFEPSLLQMVSEALPKQSVGLITESRSPLRKLDALGASHLIAHWKILKQPLIEQAHKRGMHVSTWTVNDASVITKLYKLGVDSVITDYPSMAMPLVAQLKR